MTPANVHLEIQRKLTLASRPMGLSASDFIAIRWVMTVILGLAAQETLGNIFAGVVLQTTRPFRVGERVRLQGGPMAGQVEGIVGSLGLFYVNLVDGANRLLIPNSLLLQTQKNLSPDAYAAMVWMHDNLPHSAVVMANTYTDGSVGAVTGMVGVSSRS